MNNDPEIKQILEIMKIMICFETLRSKDLITDEELKRLKESVISDYDIDSLIEYLSNKKKGDKNGFSKKESSEC